MNVVMTRNAQAILDEELGDSQDFVMSILNRHFQGDWGEICEEDKGVNGEAMETGARLMSIYSTEGGTKVWVITDAGWKTGEHQVTTVLLPEDY